MKIVHYIYRIVNLLSNKSYIGYTINPERRWKAHIRLARSGRGFRLHYAMREDGIDNFLFSIIHETEDRMRALHELEPHYIELVDSKSNGYNSTTGGAGTIGWNPSEETRALWSEQRKGRKHTEEYKRKVSERMKRNPPTHNPETRAKLSKTMKIRGIRPLSTPDTILKIKLANTGKVKHSDEHKAKLSERLKNKPLLSCPKALEKQKQNRKGKGCGERNGRAKFCAVIDPFGNEVASGHLRTICERNGFPFSSFLENSRKDEAMQRGAWKGWNVITLR